MYFCIDLICILCIYCFSQPNWTDCHKGQISFIEGIFSYTGQKLLDRGRQEPHSRRRELIIAQLL